MEGFIRYVGPNVTALLSNIHAAYTERMRPTPAYKIPWATGSDLHKSEQMCGDRTCGEAGAPINAHPTVQPWVAREATVVSPPTMSERTQHRTGIPGPAPPPHKVYSYGNAGPVIAAHSAHIMSGKNSSAPRKPRMMLAQ